MRFHTLRDWMFKQLNVKKSVQIICLWYVLSLMVETRKHSLSFAAQISQKHKSQLGKFLKNRSEEAVHTLDALSKKNAKALFRASETLKGLPWSAALLIDATLQGRSSLRTENAKKFNHGKGFVIGHQWTNIVLLVEDFLVPLPPIAFYSKKYCRENKLGYKTEHKRVIEYLQTLNLILWAGPHDSRQIVVLADSGYDDKRIENVVFARGWDFVIALKSKRSVKSVAQQAKTAESQGWLQAQEFFRRQRRLSWQTVRLLTNGVKRRRKEFRIRHTPAVLKNVGYIQLVCSEWKKGPKGPRKYFACSLLTLAPRLILLAYRLRWQIELFHKAVKMHFGFEDISTQSFKAAEAHVHWVYCAYILLHNPMPGMPSTAKTVQDRQQHVMNLIGKKEKAQLLQQLTRINGLRNYKSELKEALAA